MACFHLCGTCHREKRAMDFENGNCQGLSSPRLAATCHPAAATYSVVGFACRSVACLGGCPALVFDRLYQTLSTLCLRRSARKMHHDAAMLGVRYPCPTEIQAGYRVIFDLPTNLQALQRQHLPNRIPQFKTLKQKQPCLFSEPSITTTLTTAKAPIGTAADLKSSPTIGSKVKCRGNIPITRFTKAIT